MIAPSLDTRHAVETPEGIDLVLVPAGPLARALAYLIDFALRAGLWLAVMGFAALAGAAGTGLALVAAFLLEWFYPVLFEVYRNGATPGKRALGLAVVSDDGTPVGWGQALTRNLLRAVDFLPLAYVAGVIAMVVAGRFRRLGDLAAGTLVVYLPKPRPGRPLEVEGQVPPPPLDEPERQALLDFAESGARLSPQRRRELANILEPLTGCRDEAAVEHLVRMANALTGRR